MAPGPFTHGLDQAWNVAKTPMPRLTMQDKHPLLDDARNCRDERKTMTHQGDVHSERPKSAGLAAASEAHRAMVERLKAAGVEACRVVGPQDKDDACLDWVGAVVSLTGAVPGLPTVEHAVRDGLFHPGCRHSLTSFDPAKVSARQTKEAETRTVHAVRAMNARAQGKPPPPLAVRRYILELASQEAQSDSAGATKDRLKFERVYESARKAKAAGDLHTFQLKCRAALDILRQTDIYGARQAELMAMLERSLKGD